MKNNLTDAELLVLGLVAEMPRHGYQLEQVIEQRGMREWTRIGFSSIYFVLGRLEMMGLVAAKKIFSMTDVGHSVLKSQSLTALSKIRPTYSSVLLGMAHWPALERSEAMGTLEQREHAIEVELARLENILIYLQPLPDFIESLFDFSPSQLKAEAGWIERTLISMKQKP
jgi:DNA-binding PadR family transcriptional regulator